jgi:hypothetical protein
VAAIKSSFPSSGLPSPWAFGPGRQQLQQSRDTEQMFAVLHNLEHRNSRPTLELKLNFGGFEGSA